MLTYGTKSREFYAALADVPETHGSDETDDSHRIRLDRETGLMSAHDVVVEDCWLDSAEFHQAAVSYAQSTRKQMEYSELLQPLRDLIRANVEKIRR